MIKNYLKIAWRNTWAQGSYTILSMLGLSLGLAVFISVLVYVNREYSYDRWDPQLGNVYRVITDSEWDGDYETTPFSSAALGYYMQEQLPEVELSTTFRELGESVVKVGEEEFYDRQIIAVDSNFFKVFPYHFLYGNPAQALNSPYQAVISQKISERWFGENDPVGKTIEVNRNTYTIAAVFEQTAPSHLDIHVCLSAALDNSNWNVQVFNSYVLLKPTVSIHALEEKATEAFIYNFALGQQASPYSSKEANTVSVSNVDEASNWLDQFIGIKNIRVSLEEVANIHLNPKAYGWRDAPSNHPVLDFEKGNHIPVIIFSIIGFLVLLLASFNYMNVAIAIGNEKAKDAGLRKIIGATKSQLAFLSLASSFMQVLISLFAAVLFSYFIIAYLNKAFGMELELWSTFNASANLTLVIQLVVATLVMTLLTGLYPALVLTSYKPVQLLKGELRQGQKGLRLRNALVVVQFVVAITFIACLLIMRHQLTFMRNNDPGFNGEQVLCIDGSRVPIDFFTSLDAHASLINSLKALPEIKSTATTHFYPGQASHSLQTVRFGADGDTLSVQANWVGLGYFETLDIDIAQGRSFSTDYASDTINAAIINHTAVMRMGLAQPIGETISALGMNYRIVGVIQDIHVAGYQKAIGPELYVIGTMPGLTGGRKQLLVKFHDGYSAQQALEKVEAIWGKIDDYGPMRYTWLEDAYANLLIKYETLDRLVSMLTSIAILISVMGVFALSAFVAQQRTKEIGIRKVLGASVSGIVAMLSRDFVKLVFVAILIASPIAWWAMNRWLEDFAYRIDIEWWMFAAAGLVAVTVAMLTVSYLSKSGKATPGVGYFRSGQAGQAKRGLEILGIAAIDIDNHTGFHLQACQTFVQQDSSLGDNHAASIIAHKEARLAISKTVVADAGFTKKGFVDAICGAGFRFVGRLRDDADLKYLHQGQQSKGQRGRPKKYDGKIAHWLPIDKDIREAFSMADVKTLNQNTMLLKRFFHKFGINPNSAKPAKASSITFKNQIVMMENQKLINILRHYRRLIF